MNLSNQFYIQDSTMALDEGKKNDSLKWKLPNKTTKTFKSNVLRLHLLQNLTVNDFTAI